MSAGRHLCKREFLKKERQQKDCRAALTARLGKACMGTGKQKTYGPLGSRRSVLDGSRRIFPPAVLAAAQGAAGVLSGRRGKPQIKEDFSVFGQFYPFNEREENLAPAPGLLQKALDRFSFQMLLAGAAFLRERQFHGALP